MRPAPPLLAVCLFVGQAATAAEKATPVSAEKAQRPLSELLAGPALDAYLKGRDLFDAGDVITGHAKLLEAYEISKNPRLLWNLAACSKSARHYARAIRELTAFLRDGADQITREQGKRAEEVRATLYSLVAAVSVKATPAGTVLAVDDEPQPAGEGTYFLELGKHEFRVTRDGFRPETRVIDVRSTKPMTVEFDLRPELAAAAVPSPAVAPSMPPPAPTEPGTTQDAAPTAPTEGAPSLAYAAWIIGAAGVLAGTTFGLLAVGSEADLARTCTNGTCPPSSQGVLDDAHRWATFSTAGWVVGSLGLAGGVYMHFATSSAPAALRLSPAGMSFEGRF